MLVIGPSYEVVGCSLLAFLRGCWLFIIGFLTRLLVVYYWPSYEVVGCSLVVLVQTSKFLVDSY